VSLVSVPVRTEDRHAAEQPIVREIGEDGVPGVGEVPVSGRPYFFEQIPAAHERSGNRPRLSVGWSSQAPEMGLLWIQGQAKWKDSPRRS
jgi:hypothetical protein